MTLPEFPERPEGAAPSPQPAQKRAVLAFEPSLVSRLRGTHKALNDRIASLVGQLESDPAACIGAVEDCARQFSAVRHIETIWLYPLLEQAVQSDAGARNQFLELRLIALMLARRTQRCFDELLQALRAEVLVADAAQRVADSLAQYSRHGDQVVYPLYELVGTQPQSGDTRVA